MPILINKNNIYLLQNNTKMHIHKQYYISFEIIPDNGLLAFIVGLILSWINFLWMGKLAGAHNKSRTNSSFHLRLCTAGRA